MTSKVYCACKFHPTVSTFVCLSFSDMAFFLLDAIFTFNFGICLHACNLYFLDVHKSVSSLLLGLLLQLKSCLTLNYIHMVVSYFQHLVRNYFLTSLRCLFRDRRRLFVVYLCRKRILKIQFLITAFVHENTLGTI